MKAHWAFSGPVPILAGLVIHPDTLDLRCCKSFHGWVAQRIELPQDGLFHHISFMQILSTAV